MKLHKRIPALVIALGLILASLAGCSGKDTSWIAQSGEDTIPVGVYMVEMMMGYNDAAGQLPGAKDILKETIGDIPAVQYISDYAKAECAKLLAIRREYADRGLSLSDEEWAQSTSYTDYLYSIGEDFYNANGVAKESVGYINDTTMMSLALFNSIYGEGGEKEVPKADLEKEFSSTYTRSQYVYFPKIDMYTGAPLSDEEIAASREKAEAYLARAQAGEKLFDLYKEVAAEMDPDADLSQLDESQYDIYLENNAGYFYPSYESAVVSAADNEVKLVEEDSVIFLIKKLPLMEGNADAIATYLSNILQTQKYDEYNETLIQWSQDMDIRYNNAALGAYTPSKLKMTQEALAAAAAENSGSEGGDGIGWEDAADYAEDALSEEPQPASGSQPAEGPSEG